MAILRKLSELYFRSIRFLIFAWIRPTVIGADQFSFSDDDRVCYALPFRSFADLLVTDRICADASLPLPTAPVDDKEERALFFIAHPEGWFGRRSQRTHSPRMARLLTHQAGSKDNTLIVPVSIYWGHQPDREKSLLKLILSENWTVTNGFRKLLAMIFHPRHILVQYSPPIRLAELIEGEPDHEKQVRKLHRVLRVHFKNQRQAIIGPDLSHRRTLINNIVHSRPVQTAVEALAAESDVTEVSLRKTARSLAMEIASHQSYRVIRFFHILLTWLWHRLYEGIEVNHVNQVQRLARSHEIIYVPCHRSHIDYLLLSYVLYHNGLTPPHIAAGINLNLPLVGGLLRRAGAFFMRRSFRGDLLYQSVFDEYLHQMFTKGYSVEYFIEGGRSRTGRSLEPRTGMLAMTLSSYLRDSGRPICMMPVYFGYERVMEVATYLGELSGKSKKAESLWDILGVLRSFRHSFGQVSVNFGEPLLLDDFLDRELPTWRDSDSADPEVTRALARSLITRINDAAAVNPVALTATALLCKPTQTIEESQLEDRISQLRRIALELPYSRHLTVTDLSPADTISHTIKVAGLIRESHDFGSTLSADHDLAAILTYYRNNVIHLFALPSLIARFVHKSGEITAPDIRQRVQVLFPYLRSELLLPLDDTALTNYCDSCINLLDTMGLLSRKGDLLTQPDSHEPHLVALMDLAEVIEPTLERFFIVAKLLERIDGHELASDSLEHIESAASGIAQKLSALYGINSPTFFDPRLFRTFISTLKQEQIIEETANGLILDSRFEEISSLTAVTLDADIRLNVLQAMAPGAEPLRLTAS